MDILLLEIRTNRFLKEILFIPNLLSVLRILLSPVLFLLVIFPSSLTISIVVLSVFIIASVTDFLDGYLARKLNLVSDTGKVIDPIADKLMIGISLYVFAMLQLIYWWMAIVIISREVIITVHRFYLLSKGEVIGAEKSGKFKMGSQITLIIITLLWIISLKLTLNPLALAIFKYGSIVSAWATLFLTLLSGVDYFVNVYVKKDFSGFKISLAASTLFGLGRFTKMPGTLGSLATIALLLLLNQFNFHTLLLPLIFVSLYFYGVFCASIAENKYGHDANIIIIDEFAGQMVPFLFIDHIEPWHYIAGFALFRFFDILKPFGINKSQKLPYGWGVMTDDLIAGIFSLILLHGAILVGKIYL